MNKDSSGLCIIDYAIFKRKNAVAEFIEGVVKNLGDENCVFDYPKVAKIEASEVLKSDKEIEIETRFMSEHQKLVKEV